MNDNALVSDKLALRAEILDRYHPIGKRRVFDACSGDSVLWSRLRLVYPLDTYWGVDLKAKLGKMKINSAWLLKGGIRADIYDLDTYGSPWQLWESLLPTITEECSVIFTLGKGGGGIARLTNLETDYIGLGEMGAPAMLISRLRHMVVPYGLRRAEDFNLTIVDYLEVQASTNARYFAIHLVPDNSP